MHILDRANQIIRLANSHPDPQLYLIRAMAPLSNPRAIAPLILAYQHILGEAPFANTPVFRKAMQIAISVLENYPEISVCPDTPTTDWDIPMPSDAARAQAAQLRAETGVGAYRGPRFVPKRERPTGYQPWVALAISVQAD